MTQYRPSSDIDKLAARFAAQAAARNAGWPGKPGKLAVWGDQKDRRRMLKIIARAKKSSTVAQQAIAWARAHNVVFAIEQRKGSISGHYSKGVVTLCLSDDDINDFFNAHRQTRTLVHEIRHAWQDYYGLLSVPDGGKQKSGSARTSDQLIVNALYEADAMTVGEMAYKECVRMRGVSNYPAVLRLEFKRWFGEHAGFYHTRKIDHLGFVKNPFFKAVAACFNVFARTAQPQAAKTVDWQLYLSKLGRTFDGFDYLASSPRLRDMLLREVLSPSRALGQFDARKKTASIAQKLDLDDRRRALATAQKHKYKMPFPQVRQGGGA